MSCRTRYRFALARSESVSTRDDANGPCLSLTERLSSDSTDKYLNRLSEFLISLSLSFSRYFSNHPNNFPGSRISFLLLKALVKVALAISSASTADQDDSASFCHMSVNNWVILFEKQRKRIYVASFLKISDLN